MVNLEQSDFQFLYNYALELGYTTTDLDVPVPRYLIYDNYENLQERDALLEKYKEKREGILVRKRGGRSAEFPAAEAAAILLQLERSRQAWVIVAEMIRTQKDTMKKQDIERRRSHKYSVEQKAAVRRIQAVSWGKQKSNFIDYNLELWGVLIFNWSKEIWAPGFFAFFPISFRKTANSTAKCFYFGGL